ncbi:hypothetical protein BD414DRAFT_580896 [Trametes punicea]|nr:hypothetical protein BD414DRAFT_580896 [Trametes punicea]
MATRRPYTDQEDELLAKYIAKYNPQPSGRSGNLLYQRLVENAEGKWPFAKHHSWQSWRERYVNNRASFDRLINKYVKKYHTNAVHSASDFPASQPSVRSDAEGRVQYSREDDERLVEYLALHRDPEEGLLGKKLWQSLEDKADGMPWVKRHSWQSWRERYKKNQDYFNWAVSQYLAGGDLDDPPVRRPKTAEDFRVHKPAMSARAAARASQAGVPRDSRPSGARLSEKRTRPAVMDAEADERPTKKTRVEDGQQTSERQGANGAGPSQVAIAKESAVDMKDNEHQPSTAIGEAAKEQGDNGPPVDDHEEDEAESDEEAHHEESLAPPGSDDYHGEIFNSPEADADVPEVEPADDESIASDSTKDEQEELNQLLQEGEENHEGAQGKDSRTGDDRLADIHGNDASTERQPQQLDEGAEGVEYETGPHVSEPSASPVSEPLTRDPVPPSGPSNANSLQNDTHRPAECTESHVPPARKHNMRIRDAEAPCLTPELSPTQEAVVRHAEQKPLTAPRRHAKRIKKPQEDDIFGTPPSTARSESSEFGEAVGAGKQPSSPAAEAEARHHAYERPRVRQPPRLDEGAFNKAFSDVRGRPRVSPSGKPRRRSGVEFEDGMDEDDSSDSQGILHSDQEEPDRNEEHESELAQWPPAHGESNGKRKGKGKAPAAVSAPETPSPVRTPKGKGRERTVTTEEFFSVKTVRTVERRVGRPAKATPFPRRALASAAVSEDGDETMGQPESPPPPQNDDEIAPAPPDAEMDVEGEDDAEDAWLSPSQHHPFSQAPHPFSQQADPSPVRPASGHSGIPVSKSELSLVQSLLRGKPAVAESSRNAFSNTGDTTKPRKSAPLSDADRARLEKILRMEGRHAFPEPSKLSRPSGGSTTSASSGVRIAEVPTNEAAGNTGDDEDRGEYFTRAQTSPLADKGDSRSGSAQRRGEIVPPGASAQQNDHGDQHLRAVDKGKRRADAVDRDIHSRRYTVGGFAARDVFHRSEERTGLPRSSRRARQSLPSFLGDDGLFANRTALSLALHPPSFEATRSVSIPSTAALSRSVSPAKSGDVSLADTLPPHELEMVKELGMNTALHIMSRNHGFSEETVRKVYALTGSLEVADNVLREMREGANEKASEALTSLMPDDDDGEGQEEHDLQAEGFEGRTGEEEEVERELTQSQDWNPNGASFDLADEPPLAESSRMDASHYSRRSSGPDAHRRQEFRIEPLVGDNISSIDSQYSPPKHTRAAQYVRRARDSMGRSRRESAAPEAMLPEATASTSNSRGEENADIGFSKLARLDKSGWQRLEEKHGKGFAKVLAGKALAKLLQQ